MLLVFTDKDTILRLIVVLNCQSMQKMDIYRHTWREDNGFLITHMNIKQTHRNHNVSLIDKSPYVFNKQTRYTDQLNEMNKKKVNE